MAERKAYRNSRTGGIRLSTGVLGFPYVEATKADLDALPGRKAKTKTRASDTDTPTTPTTGGGA